jgi:hypothetical protein
MSPTHEKFQCVCTSASVHAGCEQGCISNFPCIWDTDRYHVTRCCGSECGKCADDEVSTKDAARPSRNLEPDERADSRFAEGTARNPSQEDLPDYSIDTTFTSRLEGYESDEMNPSSRNRCQTVHLESSGRDGEGRKWTLDTFPVWKTGKACLTLIHTTHLVSPPVLARPAVTTHGSRSR